MADFKTIAAATLKSSIWHANPEETIQSDKRNCNVAQEGMSRRVAKIPISKTFNEQAAMGVADCGGQETFLRLQDTSPRDSIILFNADNKRRGNG